MLVLPLPLGAETLGVDWADELLSLGVAGSTTQLQMVMIYSVL